MTPNPRQLWYVMGGYTLANYSLDILPEVAPASLPKNLEGVFIGLGVALVFMGNTSRNYSPFAFRIKRLRGYL